jgi:hypothetical protein
MRSSIYLILFLGVVFTSCRKDPIAKDTPTCIKKIIKEQRKNLCAYEGSTVKEYLFQDETIYELKIARGCFSGGASNLYDAECNVIANSLGGLFYSVIDSVNGEPFSNAEFVRKIWEKK